MSNDESPLTTEDKLTIAAVYVAAALIAQQQKDAA
ncbi:Uncharacterised protein [Mycobacteroides abscessus subsp. abscessus]|nr:Uncharacterised protein [Mycobacteroides abscessus subsp. abscessus]